MEITLEDLWQKYKDGERDFENLNIVDPTGLGLSGKLLYAINLRGSKLNGLKLSNIDFTEADFSNADLTGCNLQGCKLIQVNFENTILRKVNLRSAILHLVNFKNAIFQHAIYDPETHFPANFDPRITGSYLIAPNSILIGADLSNADLKDAKLQGANLENADLSNTNLTGSVNLHHTNLSNANLSNASMSKAVLTKANLQNAYLKGADLSLVDFTEANLYKANLVQSCLTLAIFNHANLEEANLQRVWVKRWGPDFSEANLRKANLSEANLGEQAELIDTRLNGANLRKIRIWRGDLSDSDLTGADLRDGNFKESNFARVILDQAKLEGAKLERVNLVGTIIEYIPENTPKLPVLELKESVSNGNLTSNYQTTSFHEEFPAIATDKDIYSYKNEENSVKTWKEIHFHSESELRIAQNLEKIGITFFTNCQGFVNKNVENNQVISFLVFYKNNWGILQVKTKSFLEQKNTNQNKSLVIPGISIIEYYDDHLCFEHPSKVVEDFLKKLSQTVNSV